MRRRTAWFNLTHLSPGAGLCVVPESQWTSLKRLFLLGSCPHWCLPSPETLTKQPVPGQGPPSKPAVWVPLGEGLSLSTLSGVSSTFFFTFFCLDIYSNLSSCGPPNRHSSQYPQGNATFLFLFGLVWFGLVKPRGLQDLSSPASESTKS